MSQVLGKHKYYCEMCKKQCKDENAFKQHKRTSYHQQKMMEFNENPEYFIEQYSQDLEHKFTEMFRIKYGSTNIIPANKAYNEYIKDPYHTHLNSTKWTNLTEFVTHLQEIGNFEISKEQTPNGEQLMLKFIDKNSENKELTDKQKKELSRELERKREQKELEKIIIKANKMQQTKQNTMGQGQTSVISNQIQISFGDTIEIKPEVQKKNPFFKGFSSNDDDQKSELLMLQQKQTHKSNLDKLLEHQSYKRPKIEQIDKNIQKPETHIAKPYWIKQGLIGKIKQQGPYYKEKGEVIKAESKDKITVQLQNDQSLHNFKESELDKVIPNEGGMVMVLSMNKQGIVNKIDLKNKSLEVDIDGDIVQLKFDDVCKIKSNS